MDSTETGSEKVRSAQEREGAGKMERMSLYLNIICIKEEARIEICIIEEWIKEATSDIVASGGPTEKDG